MRLCFNEHWLFAKDKADPQKENDFTGNYKPVSIPHDFLIENANDLYETCYGRYIKKYDFGDVNNKRFRLYFEGVYMDCTIYVNKKPIFDWKYGYSSFEVDLTGHLHNGINEIAVLVRHLSPNSRWYSGAGIYRDVWLFETPLSAIETDSLYLHSEQTKENSYHCELSLSLIEPQKNETVTVKLSSKDRDLFVTTLPANNLLETTFDLHDLTEDDIWDIDHPNCLTLTVFLLDKNGALCDEVTKITGLRDAKFVPGKGFFLNGRQVKLHGVCLHHDLGCLGAAFHKEAARRQLLTMKEMGANAVRTSHNMPAPGFMDLCDELGILVDSEAFDMWERPKTPYDYARFFDDWFEKDVKSWICRDRNHPSVIMWSVGNEIYDTHISERGVVVAKLLHEAVRKHDPKKNAPTTIGSNYMPWEGAQNCAKEVDLAGYNYGERLYLEHQKKYPDWCIYGSETTSGVKSRGVYHFPLDAAFMTHDDLQCSSLGNCRAGISAQTAQDILILDRDIPVSAGMFIWTGADYIGEPSPYSTKNAYFGNIDTAGLKKDSFYLYQAAWTDEPVLHLMPYWDYNDGQLIDVVVYTNLSEVTLLLNGVTVGSCVVTNYTATFHVPYEKGELRVMGTTKDGETIFDVRHSFSDSAAIVLTPQKACLKGDGEDILCLEVSTIDQNGYEVQNARDRIFLRVFGGRLLGFDNGDSTDYDSYKSSSRRLFSGKAVAYIAAPSDDTDTVIVTANATGLRHSTIMIPVIKGTKRPGISTDENVLATPEIIETPLRKIELKRDGGKYLSIDHPSCKVTAKKIPMDTTYPDLVWSIVTNSGIKTNIASITFDEKDPDTAVITALGDGDFRLRCQASNGRQNPEIISEYEFTNVGFGKAFLNPYEFIPGCLYNDSITVMDEVQNGGVNIKPDNNIVGFTNTDFGATGSDTFLLRAINWHSDAPFSFKLWVGYPQKENSRCLGEFTYQANFEWQTYKDNVYTLNERLKGVTDLYFEFEKNHLRVDFGGFMFTPVKKAYDVNLATSYQTLHGDTYTLTKDAVTHIGNNVFFTFSDMTFDEGTSAISITGKTHHDNDSIHVHFTLDGELVGEELVEFPYSKEVTTVTIPLKNMHGSGMVEMIFLPGCDFDFVSFQIHKA